MLNAFRHQRFLRFLLMLLDLLNTRSAQRLSASKVSALSGRRRNSTVLERAQRLSASKVSALAAAAPREVSRAGCSTPFGIKGFCAESAQNTLLGISTVLNAFRHQRFLRLGIRSGLKDHGNVLNAFRHQRFLRRNSRSASMTTGSAQRLSASKVSAPLQGP